MEDMTTLQFAIDGGTMKPELTGNQGDRSLFTEKEHDKLTVFERNLLERAARRGSMGLFLSELTIPQLVAKGTLFCLCFVAFNFAIYTLAFALKIY